MTIIIVPNPTPASTIRDGSGMKAIDTPWILANDISPNSCTPLVENEALTVKDGKPLVANVMQCEPDIFAGGAGE